MIELITAADLEPLADAIADFTDDIRALRDTLTTDDTRHAALEQTVATINAAQDRLIEDVSELQVQYAELRAAVAALQRRLPATAQASTEQG